MRPWMLPAVLAVLVMPSVAPAVAAVGSVLSADGTVAWEGLVSDLARAVLMVGLALLALWMAGRRGSAPLWLLDRRVLSRVGRDPDRS